MSKHKVDYSILPDDMKKENTLFFNDYKKNKELSGTSGVAQLIHTLLLLKPGTYPNSPDMGINIRKYQFEILDETKIEEIKNEIIEQVNRYVVDGSVVQLSIQVLNKDPNTVLALAFSISSIEGNMSENFIIFAAQSKITKDISTFITI